MITSERTFQLGPWTARPRLGELSGPGGDLHLEPKVMGVLTCLAEHAGEVVTRDQFVEAVWDGRAVSDEVLSRCISMLRTRLGDNPRDPRYIRTVPKIGYQLLADVHWADATGLLPSPADVQAAGRSGQLRRADRLRRTAVTAGVIALTIFVLWLGASLRSPQSDGGSTAGPILAVLPFANLSDDAQNEYLSDGLTEDLIDRFAQLPELRVVASTSAFAFKGKAIDVRDIADQLGVSHVLQGSVRRDGDRLRITAALTDADTGLVGWSESFDRAFRDIFAVQDDISTNIVVALRPQLGAGGAAAAIEAAPTTVMPAYERVLRGRFHLRTREEAPILRSIELFREAIELDPGFGDAYRNLAMAYALLPTYSYEDPDEMFRLAEDALDRGVDIDPALDAKINDVRAFLHYSRWEWVAAERAFRAALEQTPNDPNLHQWYSQQLAAVGKPALALQSVRRAHELDMLSPAINQRLAVVYQWVDDDENAYRQFELARELGLGPRANPESYAIQLLRRGEFDRARDILLDLQRAFRRASEWVDPFIAALRDPEQRNAAREALRTVADDRQIGLKYLHGALVYLGDADAAMNVSFDLLNDPLEFEIEFLFARENEILRRHPRFGELVRAIGLVDYWDEYGWPPACRLLGGEIDCR